MSSPAASGGVTHGSTRGPLSTAVADQLSRGGFGGFGGGFGGLLGFGRVGGAASASAVSPMQPVGAPWGAGGPLGAEDASLMDAVVSTMSNGGASASAQRAPLGSGGALGADKSFMDFVAGDAAEECDDDDIVGADDGDDVAFDADALAAATMPPAPAAAAATADTSSSLVDSEMKDAEPPPASSPTTFARSDSGGESGGGDTPPETGVLPPRAPELEPRAERSDSGGESGLTPTTAAPPVGGGDGFDPSALFASVQRAVDEGEENERREAKKVKLSAEVEVKSTRQLIEKYAPAAGVVLILIIALVLILINLQGAPFLERRECAPR